MTTRNDVSARSTRSTRSTRSIPIETQVSEEPTTVRNTGSTRVRKSTRKPPTVDITETKVEHEQEEKSNMSRTFRFGEIRRLKKMMIPAQTILFMFVTLIVVAIAFGILYEGTATLRHDANTPKVEQTESKLYFQEVQRKRNTSTNTGILQGGGD